jgi:hypothetical protein
MIKLMRSLRFGLAGLVLLVGACASGQVGLYRTRELADDAARGELAKQEAALRAKQRQLALKLEDYDVKAAALTQGGERGWHFLYVHKNPAIGLGPGEGHFSVWISTRSGRAVYIPGR